MEWLFILGVCLLVFLVIGMIQDDIMNEKKEAMEKSIFEQTDFSATQKIMGCDGNSGVAIDEVREKIGLISNELNQASIRIISYRDLLSSEIFEDNSTITKTSRSSQLGGALIGGVALGGVGAIIGGLSGRTKTSVKIKHVALRLTINDTLNPIHDITFQNVEGNKGGLIHAPAMTKARHWHGLCEVLIKRADIEYMNSNPQIAKAIPQTYVADELKKLAELQSAGVLSAEEFQQQKALLLRG